jgi:hypothetical protein
LKDLKVHNVSQLYYIDSPDVPGCQPSSTYAGALFSGFSNSNLSFVNALSNFSYYFSVDNYLVNSSFVNVTSANIQSGGYGFLLNNYNNTLFNFLYLLENNSRFYLTTGFNVSLNNVSLQNPATDAGNVYGFYISSVNGFSLSNVLANSSYTALRTNILNNSVISNMLVANGNISSAYLGLLYFGAGSNVSITNVSVRDSNSSISTGGMVLFYGVSNVRFSNSSLSNFSGNGFSFITNAGNNVINNCTVNMNVSSGFYDFYNFLATNNSIIDSVFNKSRIGFNSVDKSYNISVGYSVRVNASNATDGSGIASTIIVYDNTGRNILNSSTTALTGISSYFVVPEFYVWGLSNYTEGCINKPNLTCYTPYNFTAMFSPYEYNSTLKNISTPYNTINISIAYCTPPSSGTWSLNKLCIVNIKNYNLPGRNLECNSSCHLVIINSNFTIANMTFKGNYSFQNSSIIWGAR